MSYIYIVRFLTVLLNENIPVNNINIMIYLIYIQEKLKAILYVSRDTLTCI